MKDKQNNLKSIMYLRGVKIIDLHLMVFSSDI